MHTLPGSAMTPSADPVLVRRVNQLYHELTHASFDDEHRYRHRVEQPFWESVARVVLGRSVAQTARATSPPADPTPERVVVDLACGTGFVTTILAPWLGPQDRVIAIDLGRAPLAVTARKWQTTLAARQDPDPAPRLDQLVADGQHLPLADRSVDLLAINASLHHLPDPPAALRQIDRVLKPGGHFALGFEPNHDHFASPAAAGLARTFDRAFWYASPRQNWRRLTRAVTGPAGTPARPSDVPDDVLTAAINDRLAQDGLVHEPVATERLLDLVDPHARGTDGPAGFDPAGLLRRIMPDYRALRLASSDYLGQSARQWPLVRRFADLVLGTLLPHHGSLFSWLIRKPRDQEATV